MTNSLTTRAPVAGQPFVGFRLRRATTPAAPATPKPAALAADPDALARLLARLPDLGMRFWSMSDDAFGDWVDALPFDEFLEWVGLGAERIGKALKPYLPERLASAAGGAAAIAASGAPDAGGGQECLSFADTIERASDRRRAPRGRQGGAPAAATVSQSADADRTAI